MTEDNSIRILQVVGREMSRGGLETWLMHVLREIDRERFQMDFVVEGEGVYDEEIRALGSKITQIPYHQRPLIWGRNFSEILRDRAFYDVVHSNYHYYNGYVLRLAKRANVPIRIAHSHNDFSQVDKERSLLWNVYAKLMRNWLDQNATVGLAASREAAAALYGANWQSNPRWRLLYYGIDLEPFKVDADPAAIRAELGIARDAFVVGHVGRFDEQKNHGFLVDIAAELTQRFPKIHLLLIGDGVLRPGIQHRVMQAGIADKVTFAGGQRPDVARLMLGAMDIFVLPSLYEGLPLVGLEAQAAGLPFVMSDAISEEAVVIPALVRRLSISKPASLWAETILAARNSPPPITKKNALQLLEASDFSIASSVRKLSVIYAG
jgi:glycosyltransferase involved in cell wall biosynthesis